MKAISLWQPWASLIAGGACRAPSHQLADAGMLHGPIRSVGRLRAGPVGMATARRKAADPAVAREGRTRIFQFAARLAYRRSGYVKDVEMFGGKLLRIDITVTADKTVTEFYGCNSIYALRPCEEAIVRDHVKNSYDGDMRPVRPLEYRECETARLANGLQCSEEENNCEQDEGA